MLFSAQYCGELNTSGNKNLKSFEHDTTTTRCATYGHHENSTGQATVSDRDFMLIAIEEAVKAGDAGEIPVGAVIVRHGEILSRGRNSNRCDHNPVRHAEISAIESAAASLGNERLTGCDMYVTKEPCAMCAGAIVHARIRRLVIGARDLKYGACGSVLSVCGDERLNHRPEIIFGVMEDECSSILKNFFSSIREASRSQGIDEGPDSR